VSTFGDEVVSPKVVAATVVMPARMVRVECANFGCGTAVAHEGELCTECHRKQGIDPIVIAPEAEA
jgi:hypothetical protein